MKKNIIALMLCFAFPLTAFANCALPTPPSLLQQPQLSAAQFASLDPQMELYFTAIESYKLCVNIQVSQLVPADADEAFYSSSSYQTAFQNLMNDYELAGQGMTETTNRYSYLIEIGLIQ